MNPDPGLQLQAAEIQRAAEEMRAEAARQLESARALAKRVRAEALHELEDARARVARIAAREEEMAERWARLLEAENAIAVAQKKADDSPSEHLSEPGTDVPSEPASDLHSTLVVDAQSEAQQIIARANQEARRIREEAMHLLAVAEGEKAESREIAVTETQRAAVEAEILRAEAAEEAKRLREEAERLAADDPSAYTKRAGRKLPRIGDGASSVLSEMSGLRAKMAEEDDRQVS